MSNMASNHSTSLSIPQPHFTSCITAHQHLSQHTIPQHTFQTTPHIPHCISTSIPHHTTMSNMASNHSTSLGIPQPHFTSCITAHHHIPHAPHHHSTSYHHISHLTLHDITPCHTYSTSHLIPHHSHIRMTRIRHNIPHLALQNVAHHTKFHTTLFHITPCDLVVLKCVRCGMVCCAGNVV